MSDALGEHQDPNAAAASRRGLFTQEEDVPALGDASDYAKLADAIEKFSKLIVATTNPNDPSGVASGNTDAADGDAVIGVYQVADGMEFRASRIVVEVAGYSPEAPFSGVGSCSVYALSSVDGQTVATATALGGLRDAAAGSSTQAFLPAIFEYSDNQSPRIRGPFWLAVVISDGPASAQVTVYYQGALRRIQGII